MKIADIINNCGGAMTVAFKLKINYNTVLYWSRKGKIPNKYWETLIKWSSQPLSIEDLYSAS